MKMEQLLERLHGLVEWYQEGAALMFDEEARGYSEREDAYHDVADDIRKLLVEVESGTQCPS